MLITRARAQSCAPCPLQDLPPHPRNTWPLRVGVRIWNLASGQCACCIDVGGIVCICPGWAGCGPCLSMRTFFTPYMFPNQESCKCLLFSFANGNRQKPEGRGSDFGETSLHPQRRWLSPDFACVCAGAHRQFEGARMLPYGLDTQHQK